MQTAQDISSRVYVKKRRRSGLRRGFLTCTIGEIDKSRCVTYFSTVPFGVCPYCGGYMIYVYCDDSLLCESCCFIIRGDGSEDFSEMDLEID